jgi:hypothetical protein
MLDCGSTGVTHVDGSLRYFRPPPPALPSASAFLSAVFAQNFFCMTLTDGRWRLAPAL